MSRTPGRCSDTMSKANRCSIIPIDCSIKGVAVDALPQIAHTPNCPSRGEIPKILKLAWGKAFVEVVAMRRLACV